MKFAATTLALVLASALGASSAFAADPAPAKSLTPQQQKMKDCNAQAKAKGLKGKDYSDFRNNCLKADNSAAAPTATAPAKPMTQQEKMKVCNADAKAKGLKGKDYSDFRNNCLKGDSSATSAH